MGLFYIVVTKTNALTQTEIGTLSILGFLASTFSLITLVALPTALTKFASEKLGKNQQEEAKAIQKTVTKTVLTLSILGFLIAAFSSQIISQSLLNSPEYALFVILMLTYAFLLNIMALCNSTLQALHLFGKIAIVAITFIVSSRTLSIILALLHMGVAGVIIGYIFGALTALAVAITILHGKLPKTTKKTPLKSLMYFSLPLFLGSLAVLVRTRTDVVMIVSLSGDYSLAGIYHIVTSSLGVLSMLWIPMTTTIFPTLSAHHGLENPEAITNILKTTSRYLIYVISPSCLGLAIIAPTALTFFYGPSYTKGAIPFAILSITTIIIALHSLFTTTLTAIGKTGQILRIDIICAVSALLALLAFVPFFDIVGAAIARLTTRIVSIILATYALSKEIKIRLDKEALWKSTVASAAIVPFLLAIELIISPRFSTTLTLIIEILTATTIYTLFLYLLKALKKQDFELLKQALPKQLTKYISTLEAILVR
jgi:O-antigen/teichoic acid export membrane protein